MLGCSLSAVIGVGVEGLGFSVRRRARGPDRRFCGIYAPGRGHPSGEVVDEGAYTYTAPSSTPSYLRQTCRSVRSTGRWPVGAVAQPGAHFFAEDSKKIWRGVSFIFAFRENNRGRGGESGRNGRLPNHEDRIMKVRRGYRSGVTSILCGSKFVNLRLAPEDPMRRLTPRPPRETRDAFPDGLFICCRGEAPRQK